MFTIAAEGDPRIKSLELRNSVLVITDADSKAPVHMDLTRRELADFVLGKRAHAHEGDALAELDRILDRSHLMRLTSNLGTALQPSGQSHYNVGLEH